MGTSVSPWFKVRAARADQLAERFPERGRDLHSSTSQLILSRF